LLILHGLAEAVPGAVKEDAKVVAVDAKLAANLILVFFFEKHGAEQVAVAGGDAGKNEANLLSGFFGYY